MKITKQRLRQIVKEEITERLSSRDPQELANRISFLLLNAPIDEEALAELTRVVYDLEKRYPIPEREPKRGDVRIWDPAE